MGSLIFLVLLMCSSVLLAEQDCQNVTLQPHDKCINEFEPAAVMQMQLVPHSWQHFEVYLIRPERTGFTFDFLMSAGHLMVLATKTSQTLIIPPTFMCFCVSSNDWMSLTFETNRERPVLKMLWKMFEKSITLIGVDLKEVELMRISNKGDAKLNVKIIEEDDSANGTDDISKTPPDAGNCPVCQEMKQRNENPIFFTWQDIIIFIILTSAVFGASLYASYVSCALRKARAKIASKTAPKQTTSEQKVKSRKKNCLPPTPPRKETKNKSAGEALYLNDFRADEMPLNTLPVMISADEDYEEPIQPIGNIPRAVSVSPRPQMVYHEEGNSCDKVNNYYEEDDIYEEI